MGRHYVQVLKRLVSAFFIEESRFYRSSQLIPFMEKIARILVKAQNHDGTMNAVNFASPPDTGFLVQFLGAALVVVKKHNIRELDQFVRIISIFMNKAGEMFLTGGVHTPNHRWVVSSALSYLYFLYGVESYKLKVQEWISEGIDIDDDGQFSERSMGVYSPIIANCLLDIAVYMNMPSFFSMLEKHLDMTSYYLLPNGLIENVSSRRQDQYSEYPAFRYYRAYRFMASEGCNPNYASLASRIWDENNTGGCDLIDILEHDLSDFPEPVESPIDFLKVFSKSGLLRCRNGKFDYTLFAGCDNYRSFHNGLSRNSTFLKIRKGQASPLTLRIAANFFDLNYFQLSDPDFHGTALMKAVQNYSVPYYQPLYDQHKRPNGSYLLSDGDGRFYSEMDFGLRDRSNIGSLTLSVNVDETDKGLAITIASEGAERVPVAIEVSYPRYHEGINIRSIKGCELVSEKEVFFDSSKSWNVKNTNNEPLFLKDGEGVCGEGDESIRFYPGKMEHDWVPPLGVSPLSPKPSENDYAYITLFTPIKYVLNIN
jgi:hypothetical protein